MLASICTGTNCCAAGAARRSPFLCVMEHLEVGVPSTRQESSSSTSYELRCVATVHAN
eukprot:COSAG06_NODE_817_length_12118_cov_6.463683_9_plen_57_part_01